MSRRAQNRPVPPTQGLSEAAGAVDPSPAAEDAATLAFSWFIVIAVLAVAILGAAVMITFAITLETSAQERLR